MYYHLVVFISGPLWMTLRVKIISHRELEKTRLIPAPSSTCCIQAAASEPAPDSSTLHLVSPRLSIAAPPWPSLLREKRSPDDFYAYGGHWIFFSLSVFFPATPAYICAGRAKHNIYTTLQHYNIYVVSMLLC